MQLYSPYWYKSTIVEPFLLCFSLLRTHLFLSPVVLICLLLTQLFLSSIVFLELVLPSSNNRECVTQVGLRLGFFNPSSIWVEFGLKFEQPKLSPNQILNVFMTFIMQIILYNNIHLLFLFLIKKNIYIKLYNIIYFLFF